MMPEQEAQYFNDNSGRYGASMNDGYGHSRSGFGQEFHEKNIYAGMHYDEFGPQDDGLGDGVYQYDGGRSEPYGSRGTVPTRSPTVFDDYGRSVSFPLVGNNQGGSVGKIVRAVPKEDMQPDVNNGQKFRVKLLLEGGGQNTMDVLCQVWYQEMTFLLFSTSSIYIFRSNA